VETGDRIERSATGVFFLRDVGVGKIGQRLLQELWEDRILYPGGAFEDLEQRFGKVVSFPPEVVVSIQDRLLCLWRDLLENVGTLDPESVVLPLEDRPQVAWPEARDRAQGGVGLERGMALV